MSDPIQAFTKAIRLATLELMRETNRIQADSSLTNSTFVLAQAVALASIQASAADLLLELIGEDEPLRPHLAKQDPAAIRNLYRGNLRDLAAELRGEK